MLAADERWVQQKQIHWAMQRVTELERKLATQAAEAQHKFETEVEAAADREHALANEVANLKNVLLRSRQSGMKIMERLDLLLLDPALIRGQHSVYHESVATCWSSAVTVREYLTLSAASSAMLQSKMPKNAACVNQEESSPDFEY
ncbi:hypothetical protein PRIC2_014228 [Phytophthora ramorum]